MVEKSILKQTMTLQSPLASASVIQPKQGSWKKTLAADLLLTALIDAFSILVIFLLMSFSSTGEILYVGKGMELPKAAKAAPMIERNTIVRVENGRFYVDDQETNADGLTARLVEIRRKLRSAVAGEDEADPTVTIQGDRRLKYEALNAAVLAANQAGFSDIKFAVMMK